MHETVERRLAEAGFSLPAAPTALGLYVPATRAETMIFTAGQLPLANGALVTAGTVGGAVSIEVAKRCAAVSALNALAAASTVCDLDEVAVVLRLTGFVASASGFHRQPAVIDGASEVLAAAFPNLGGHAREAIGVAELPLGAPVEVSLVLALRA